MNRRGFFGLLGKLVAVGAAMSVAPEILEPVQNAFYHWRGICEFTTEDGRVFVEELSITLAS